MLLVLHPFAVLSAELWLSLEEHQYALELIMGRYRKQMLQLMMAKKELDTKPVLSLHEDHAKVRGLSVFVFFRHFPDIWRFALINGITHDCSAGGAEPGGADM